MKVGDTVIVIHNGCSYSTHSDSKKYGCVKWKVGRIMNNGDKGTIYKLLKINGNMDGAIVEGKDGYHYLIGLLGIRLIEDSDGEIHDMKFIKWYSGMTEAKIKQAYKRYLNETK